METQSSSPSSIRLGTRASTLARWQADWVTEELTKRGHQVELIEIATQGDQQQMGPIGAIGTVGVFTKEIQRALLDGRVDLAVHSLKDLPTEPIPGLVLASVPERERCGDALLSRDNISFEDLPQGACIGTGSLRRQAQLRYARSDLEMRDIRGNVETRIAKLDAGDYDAIVLAEAGLLRLGLGDRISQTLPKSLILPAVGQGALGLETREDDDATRAAVTALNDATTHAVVLAERALLATLRGGCLAPVGAWGRTDDDGQLLFDAVVLDAAGTQRLVTSIQGDLNASADLGCQAGEQLLKEGAAELIQSSRG